MQAEPATAEWRVESGPPDTRITQPPPAKQQLARFEFLADEPSTFECRLDDAPWARCDSSRSHSVAVTNGLHRFDARATDDAGHVDRRRRRGSGPTTPIRLRRGSTTAPPTARTRPARSFLRSDEPGVRYECADLNAGDIGVTWSPCESGVPFPTRHDFVRTRAIDTAGNVDESPAEWRWSAEEGRPTVEQISATGLGPDRTSLSRDVTVKFWIGSVAAGSTVEECRLDGGVWQRCASPHRMEGLSDGAHVLKRDRRAAPAWSARSARSRSASTRSGPPRTSSPSRARGRCCARRGSSSPPRAPPRSRATSTESRGPAARRSC